MDFESFDLSNKLPYIRSSNLKIIVLVSVVLLLITVVVISNIYGNLRNKNGNVATSPTALITGSPADSGSNGAAVDLKNEAPVIALSDFLNLITEGKRDEAEKMVSEYASGDLIHGFIDEFSKNEALAEYKFLDVKYTGQNNYVVITVEMPELGVKKYKRITLIKINSVWKVFFIEAI